MKPERKAIQPTATEWERIMELYHREGYSLAGAVKKMREEQAEAAAAKKATKRTKKCSTS